MTASPADNPARSPARSRRPLLDRSHCATPVASPSSSRYCHRNMTAGHVGSGHEGERVTRAAVERVVAALSQRDREILADVTRVRVLTGRQIERLHFANLAGTHRDRKRRRVLARLVSLRLLAVLKRRIGGVRAGSAGLVFALGVVGQRLLALEANRSPAVHDGRSRHPGTPTERFLKHSLAGSELYVQLVEQARAGSLSLVGFRAEPACWWRDGEGKWIKPDAYVVVSDGDIEDSWAIEVDMATESLPTLRRKLVGYLDLVERGEKGPDEEVLPRVLVSVPDKQRCRAVRQLVRGLPPPADELFVVTLHDLVVAKLGEVLRE